MFALLFGVGVASLRIGIGAEFFRVMSLIVSFVSSEVILSVEIDPFFVPNTNFNLLKQLVFMRRDCPRRRP